jgi:hypothetical protein
VVLVGEREVRGRDAGEGRAHRAHIGGRAFRGRGDVEERPAEHVGGPKAGEFLAAAVERDDAARVVDHDQQQGARVEHGRGEGTFMVGGGPGGRRLQHQPVRGPRDRAGRTQHQGEGEQQRAHRRRHRGEGGREGERDGERDGEDDPERREPPPFACGINRPIGW